MVECSDVAYPDPMEPEDPMGGAGTCEAPINLAAEAERLDDGTLVHRGSNVDAADALRGSCGRDYGGQEVVRTRPT